MNQVRLCYRIPKPRTKFHGVFLFNQVVSENSTLVVVNLVGAEKVGSFSLKSVAILRWEKNWAEEKKL